MFIGSELAYSDQYSALERTYIRWLGVPIVGLRIRARNIFSLIPKDKTYNEILDAGSGPGVFSFELAKRFPKAKILGIDIFEEQVNDAEAVRQKVGLENVHFAIGDILDFPQKDRFDLAVCVDILEHIEDDRAAMKGLFDALAPGGYLVVHVPAFHRRYPVFKKSENFYVPTHVRTGYEPEELHGKLTDTGFEIAAGGFTYGFWETLANNISYMITRAQMKNKKLYALAFPFLQLMSCLGARARPAKLGAGVYAVARKP